MDMQEYIPRKQRTMKPSEQRMITAARQDRVYWRGEDIEDFKLVYDETMRQRSMGARHYRAESVAKLRKLVEAMA